MKQIILDYFTFTKKERRGIFTLLFIILILLFLPYFLKNSFTNKNNIIDENLKNKIAALQIIKDSSSNSHTFNSNNDDEDEKYFRDFSPKYKVYDKQIKGELFYFDPNKINVAEWQKLGVSEKTALVIQNYISKGGTFRKPEDIAKIYGLNSYMLERLMPFVKIDASNFSNKSYTKHYSQNYTYKPNSYKNFNNDSYAKHDYKTEKPDFLSTYKVDINTADTSAFIALPGIGNKLSYRILVYRNKLGGFYSVNQIAETWGIADSVFQKIKPNLVCGSTELTKMNINTATAEQLRHPYLDKSLQNNILQYRSQHGKFNNENDLRKLALMTEETLQKILPYISFE